MEALYSSWVIAVSAVKPLCLSALARLRFLLESLLAVELRMLVWELTIVVALAFSSWASTEDAVSSLKPSRASLEISPVMSHGTGIFFSVQ